MSVNVTFKGYANKPQTKTAGTGRTFHVFTVRARTDKNKDGTYNHVYLSCKDFKSSAPPADGSFVTVTGSLSVNEYEKEGAKRQGLNVFVDSLEVAEPRDKPNGSKSADGVPDWMNEV